MHTIAHSIKCAQCTIHTDPELGNGVVFNAEDRRDLCSSGLASYLPK